MLPRCLMLTIKKQAHLFGSFFSLALLILVAGCTPSGERSLHQGARLIEEGKFADAAVKLEEATKLLAKDSPAVQAQAWNHLGLAYHHSGQPALALAAYKNAVKLNRNLPEADFNLGCLQLEQKNFPGAVDALNTYLVLRPKSADGLQKLGEAQWHLAAQFSGAPRNRQLEVAEKTLEEAQKIAPSAEVLNSIGIIELQRNRPVGEAIKKFRDALKQQPNYPPAMLNLAVVYHQNLNDHKLALQKYREYLALQPRPANAKEVEAIAQALDLEINPRPVATNAVTHVAPPANLVSPATNKPAIPPNAQPKPDTNFAKVNSPPLIKPATTNAPPAIPPPVLRAAPVEVVNVSPEPPIKPANDLTAAPSQKPAPAPDVPPPAPKTPAISNVVATVDAKSKPEETPKKTSFVQKLNPVTWFSKKNKSVPTVTPLTNSPTAKPALAPVATPATPPTNSGALAAVTPLPVKPAPPRYKYLSPAKAADGNRTEATQFLSKAVTAQRNHHLPEALAAYLNATKSDPAFFDGWFYLGLAASEAKDFSGALIALENALAIKPDSGEARYWFAWSLQKANYFQDSANELEKVLAQNPKETRAHLLLGILCAQNLGEPKRARQHYLKVLEADPRHPQAESIRYWLAGNP